MKPYVVVIVSILVVILVAGLAIFLNTKQPKLPDNDQGNQKEIEEIADEIYGFTAEIEEINDKILSLNGWVPKGTEPPSSARIIVKGVVTDDTEIVKLKFPENSESQERVYPEKTPVSFENLEAGDEIHIATRENISDNIKNNESFNLKSIFITKE